MAIDHVSKDSDLATNFPFTIKHIIGYLHRSIDSKTSQDKDANLAAEAANPPQILCWFLLYFTISLHVQLSIVKDRE